MENLANEIQDDIQESNIQHIISKFLRKGFEGLQLEDLATAVISGIRFEDQFKNKTGIDWNNKFLIKALEKLNRGHFDIHWMTRAAGNPSIALFENCKKGDFERVREFILKAPTAIVYTVDEKKKSPLHICAKENHTSIIELLLANGFSPNARDRLLMTPLHVASYYGNPTCANALLKHGADTKAKDSTGRTALHYAACSNSSQMIILLLGTCPELIEIRDSFNRSALHVSVFNSSPNQIDIMRTLIERNIGVNWIDEDGKTALHYAAEGGRSRAIPILLQKGADIGLREFITKKTPLELACNDRIRELIIVYASPDKQVSEKDKQWFDNAIIGSKVIKVIPQKSPKKQLTKEEQYLLDSTKNQDKKGNVSNFLREQFFILMKQVQKIGVDQFQHYKKPYLYTGSWLEGVHNVKMLLERAQNMDSPSEALIRAFNILCPYEDELPQSNTDQESVTQFYGDPWFDGTKKDQQNRDQQISQTDILERKIEALQQNICIKEVEEQKIINQNKQLQEEINYAKKQLVDYQLKIEQYSSKQIIENKDIEKLQQNQQQLNIILKENEEQLSKIENLQQQLEKMKYNDNQQKKFIDSMQKELNNAKKHMGTESEIEKQRRYQTGKLFLQAIEDAKVNSKKAAGSNIMGTQDTYDQTLADDDAIIALFQALKKTPPGLMERMKAVDKDGDGQLLQTEFIKFCEDLGLPSLSIQCLCRVAGYFSGKSLLKISEFKSILEMRPKMREIWEKQLFSRLINNIKIHDLNSDRLFQLLDIDSNNNLSPQEFKEGIEALHICLSQQDFNSLFHIFDKDKNNLISLSEMKNAIQYYEKILSTQPLGNEEIDFAYRMQEGVGNDQFEKMASTEQVQQLEQVQEQFKMTPSFNRLSGDLKIQIPFGKGIQKLEELKQIWIYTILKGLTQPSLLKSVLLLNKNQWQFAIRLPIREELDENIDEQLKIQFYSSSNLVAESYLGEVCLNWKACLEKPNSWKINSEFPLSNIKYENQSIKATGTVGVQLNFIPKILDPETKQKFIQAQQQQPQFQYNGGPIQGLLSVRVVQILLNQKKEGVKCLIKLQNSKEQEAIAGYDEKNNPFFSETFQSELNIQPNQNIQCINLKLFTAAGKIFASNQNICNEIIIDWSECLQFPNEILTRKAYVFEDLQDNKNPENKVYVKVTWEPGMTKKKQKQQQPKDICKGTLKVLIVRGANLGESSDIDPYAEINIKAVDKVHSQFTSQKTNTQFPEYLQQLIFNDFQFYKEVVPPLQILVKDKKSFIQKDKILGAALISLTPCISEPQKWSINSYFRLSQLKDSIQNESLGFKTKEEAGKNPYIYVQAYFVFDGQMDTNIQPFDQEQKIDLESQKDFVNGSLYVRIVHARGLKIGDTHSKSSDPYCIISLDNVGEKKTKVINNCLNPIFKQLLIFENIHIEKQKLQKFKITIKDEDLAAVDDLLGFIDVMLQKVYDSPGKWAINEIFKIQGTPDIQGNLSSLGYIYIQCKLLEKGMQDDNSIPQCIEDLEEILQKEQGIYKGQIFINLLHCQNLTYNTIKDINAKVIFKVQGGEIVESNSIKCNDPMMPPFWNKEYNINICLPYTITQPIMRIELRHDQFIGSKLIGYKDLIISELFKKEAINNWSFNEIISLDGECKDSNTEIYFQMMFLQAGSIAPKLKPALKINLEEKNIQYQEEQAKQIQGVLTINIIMARGLKIADDVSSDPYAVVRFPFANDKSISTQVVNKNINPVWDVTFPQPIDISLKKYKPIYIDFKDKDTGSLDDELGQIEVQWLDCIKNPFQWSVNQLFKIYDAKNKTGKADLGESYVQARFIPKEDITQNLQKEACDTIPDLIKDYGKVIGVLKIFIDKAVALKNTSLLGTIDPFCVAFLSEDQKNQTIKTLVKNNDLNPIWNHKDQFFISTRTIIAKQLFLTIQVKHKGILTDDNLGISIVHLRKVFSEQNSQIYQEYPLFKDQTQQKQIGSIFIGLEWIPDENKSEELQNLKLPIQQVEGLIHITAYNARQIGVNSTLVAVNASNDPNNVFLSEIIKDSDSPDYNFNSQIPIKVPIHEVESLKIICSIKTKGILYGTNALSGITIPVNEIIKSSGEWINDYFQLITPKGNLTDGYISVAACFQPLSQKDMKIITPKPIEFQSFITQKQPPKVEGILQVNVYGASKLENKDLIGLSDPYVKIQFNNKKLETYITNIIKNNLNPIWEYQNSIQINSLCKEELEKLYIKFEVYDDDSPKPDEFLGEITIELKSLISKPGEWYNNIIQLLSSKGFPLAGQLYVQMQWQPKNSNADLKQLFTIAPKLNLMIEQQMSQQKQKELEEENKKKQQLKPQLKGVLCLYIIKAQQLKNKETFGTSDPYVITSLNKGSIQKVKTNTVKSNLDPEFQSDQPLEILVSHIKEEMENSIFLNVKVMDSNPVHDTCMGQTIIDVTNIFLQFGSWINSFYELTNDKGTPGEGRVYIQGQFRPENIIVDQTRPKLIENIEQKQDPKIAGKLKVNIVQAIGLKDSTLDTPDGFVIFTINKPVNQKIQELKTQVINDCLNPKWDFNGQFELLLSEKDLLDIRFNAKINDKDNISSDFLGLAMAKDPLIFANPNQWYFDKKLLLLDEKGQKTTQGELHLRIMWDGPKVQTQQADTQIPNQQQEKLVDNQAKLQKEQQIKQNIQRVQKQEDIPCKGNIEIEIVSVNKLPKGSWTDKVPDPFVECELFQNQKTSIKKFKTKQVDDKFDYDFNLKLLIPIVKDKKFIYDLLCKVIDHNYVGSNTEIGCLNVTINLETTQLIQIQQAKLKKQGQEIESTISINYRWIPE